MHGAVARRRTGRKGGLSKIETVQQIRIVARLRAPAGARGAVVRPAVHNLGGTKPNVARIAFVNYRVPGSDVWIISETVERLVAVRGGKQ
jgi:hypothetical protein